MSNSFSATPGILPLRLISPYPRLRPYVQAYWRLQSAPENATGEEFMHADGGTGLLINFSDALQLDQRHYTSGSFWQDATTETSRLHLTPCVDALGIRFRPAGAFTLLSSITSSSYLFETAGETLAAIMASLHDQLSRIGHLQEQAAYLDAWLLQRFSSGKLPSRRVIAALSLIEESRGLSKIASIANAVSTSTQELERRFKREVGLSPKQYARTCRPAHARKWLKQYPSTTSQAELAQRLCYYDEAHLIRDFSRAMGLTPGAYQARAREQEPRSDLSRSPRTHR